MNATYSPDDNKLRLYPDSRLPKDLYERVRSAGFIWAPKQELFVAPRWTPDAEDLLIELCGEIEDEDKTLAERAEERADRFDDYSHARAAEADRAHKAVKAIADNIPFGQPILVGHHSERRARKDAERIQNGMRKAVSCWETSKYWQQRASGAISHAKYKERPDVRARRIKTIEADKRKAEKARAKAQMCLDFWSGQLKKESGGCFDVNRDTALWFTNLFDQHGCSATDGTKYFTAWGALDEGKVTPEEVKAQRLKSLPAWIAHYDRWIAHYDRRLEYERAMLEADGGLAGEKFQYEVGGRIKRRGTWHVIKRINKRGGVVNSLTCVGIGWESVTLEQVQGYEPPAPGDSEKVKAAMKVAPIVNYPGEGFLHQTKDEWEKTVPKWSDFPKYAVVAGTDQHGRHRVRQTRKPNCEWYKVVGVYLTDQKLVQRPPPTEPVTLAKFVPPATEPTAQAPAPPAQDPDDSSKFEAMKETLKSGVQVVTADQLFPTPNPLADLMILQADITVSHRILEPSAGTGAILNRLPLMQRCGAVAVEINAGLATALKERFPSVLVHCTDFLACNGDLGKFDRILMNPPFANGADIKHITHAIGFLKPGGRLVAICANGPRQHEKLKPLADEWIELPDGSFKESGTNVNTAMMVVNAKQN